MFDSAIRKKIDPPINTLAILFVKQGISANQITIIGFFLGLLSIPSLALHHYYLALFFILLNRLFDGLDGAIARQTEITHTGAYLDIVLDFIFYSGVIMGFVLAQPDNALYGALLIFSFIGTGSSFLAFAIFAEKLNLSTNLQGKKSFYYLAGLAEGGETIICLSLMCLYPEYFWLISLGFAIICFLATILRITSSVKLLRSV